MLLAAILAAAIPLTSVAARADDVGQLMDQAASDYSAGNDGAAVGELQHVLQLDPRNKLAHYYLAYILFRQGDRQGAQAHFLQVAVLDGDGALGKDAEGWLRDNGTLDAMSQLAAMRQAAAQSSGGQPLEPEAAQPTTAPQIATLPPLPSTAPTPAPQPTPEEPVTETPSGASTPAPAVSAASNPDLPFVEVPPTPAPTPTPAPSSAPTPTPVAEHSPPPRATIPVEPAVPPPPGERVPIPGERLSIVAPSGWQVGSNLLDSKLSFLYPFDDGTRASIDIQAGGYDPDLDSLDAIADRLDEALQGYKEVSRKDVRTGNLAGFRLTYTCKIGKDRVEIEQYMLHDDKRKYILSYGVSPEHFSQFEDTFRAVALNLEPLTGKALDENLLVPTPVHHRLRSRPDPVPETNG